MPNDAAANPQSPGLLEPTVMRMLEQVRLPICVTDPNFDDNPIVYVNSAFLDLTGYSEEEVLNRNCRFLQGADTKPESIDEIRRAILEETVSTIEIMNYRKDGSPFVNALQIGPIRNVDGQTILHFGSQLDVTSKRDAERRQAEIEMEERAHRLRNIVNVMSVAVRLTAREAESVEDFAKIVMERLEMLGAAHFRTLEGDGAMALDDLARTVLRAYAPFGDRQIVLDGPTANLSRGMITPLTLALHELATNSVKHGALGSDVGQVAVSWTGGRDGQDVQLTWRERDGPPVAAPDRASGSRIIQSVVAAIGGSIDYEWNPDGLVARIVMPV
ncbi:MAG: PAS domain-containing protein [Jannaschia sp.]